MTKPRYLAGWAAGSKACGTAWSSDYARYVNFNNGNSNWNNRNNEFFVRAVRVGECQEAVTLQDLHAAWHRARRGKCPSHGQLTFESRWADRLLELQERLLAGTWSPSPSTLFIAELPKRREIHAPAFADRVLHHWLVPQLEAIYERTFIDDSYSNRSGKGTHAAVNRLRSFLRQVQSGQGGSFYLQLDIRNFFNCIHRPTLYAMLKERMTRHGVSLPARQATHALLRRSPAEEGVRYACTARERDQVPAHKRLSNAAPGCGIAIGNLSSQFFANVYLDQLDQFVKHVLKAKRYLRYVDDFVLIHESREQLLSWLVEIEIFLAQRLRLELKPDIKLRTIAAGVDFLGYIVCPTHTVVRRRVIIHAREKLERWGRRHVRGRRIAATPAQYRALHSTWSSYTDHFAHANSYRLYQRFADRFPWLRGATARRSFDYRLEGMTIEVRR